MLGHTFDTEWVSFWFSCQFHIYKDFICEYAAAIDWSSPGLHYFFKLEFQENLVEKLINFP